MKFKFNPLTGKLDQVTSNFTELTDVPSTFSGQGTKIVRVNAAATALEFVTAQSIEDVDWGEIGGTLSNQTDLQSALDDKANALSGTINEIAYFDTANTVASLAVATYPSLTELSYIKGLSSAIQTQLGGKLATGLAVLLDQTVGQTIGVTGARLAKLWATDITLTNALVGSITGNAATVTNATLTTALTVNT